MNRIRTTQIRKVLEAVVPAMAPVVLGVAGARLIVEWTGYSIISALVIVLSPLLVCLAFIILYLVYQKHAPSSQSSRILGIPLDRWARSKGRQFLYWFIAIGAFFVTSGFGLAIVLYWRLGTQSLVLVVVAGFLAVGIYYGQGLLAIPSFLLNRRWQLLGLCWLKTTPDRERIPKGQTHTNVFLKGKLFLAEDRHPVQHSRLAALLEGKTHSPLQLPNSPSDLLPWELWNRLRAGAWTFVQSSFLALSLFVVVPAVTIVDILPTAVPVAKVTVPEPTDLTQSDDPSKQDPMSDETSKPGPGEGSQGSVEDQNTGEPQDRDAGGSQGENGSNPSSSNPANGSEQGNDGQQVNKDTEASDAEDANDGQPSNDSEPSSDPASGDSSGEEHEQQVTQEDDGSGAEDTSDGRPGNGSEPSSSNSTNGDSNRENDKQQNNQDPKDSGTGDATDSQPGGGAQENSELQEPGDGPDAPDPSEFDDFGRPLLGTTIFIPITGAKSGADGEVDSEALIDLSAEPDPTDTARIDGDARQPTDAPSILQRLPIWIKVLLGLS